jgi:hypothetical protein
MFIMSIWLKFYGVDVLDWTEILPVDYIKWDVIPLADDFVIVMWLGKEMKMCFWEKHVFDVGELNTKNRMIKLLIFEDWWIFFNFFLMKRVVYIVIEILSCFDSKSWNILCHHLEMISENISCLMKIIYWKLSLVTYTEIFFFTPIYLCISGFYLLKMMEDNSYDWSFALYVLNGCNHIIFGDYYFWRILCNYYFGSFVID